MTATLLQNIESVPSLPESVQEVERIYQDESSTFEDMQVAIEKDPFLSANILRLVNSPMYGVKSRVTSVKQAISLLGKDSIRTFVLSSAIDADFEIDLEPYSMTPEEFKLACERQMGLMIQWLIRRNPKRIALLAPAAFMVDIGRVIISKTLIDDNNVTLLQEALAEGFDVAQAEKNASGVQTTDVTATLFHKWNLDPDIIHLIRYSDDPDGTFEEEREMAAELKVVRESVMPNGEITDASIALAKESIEEFGLDLESYEDALEKILNT